jgi:hypothetical protein
MLDKAYGSQPMQVAVAHGTSRKAGEARTGTQSGWACSQHSTKQAVPLTHVLMMMMLHTSVYSSGTVTAHALKRCIQENDAELVNM